MSCQLREARIVSDQSHMENRGWQSVETVDQILRVCSIEPLDPFDAIWRKVERIHQLTGGLPGPDRRARQYSAQ